MIGTTEIIVIALIVLLLFGGSQIPKLMKGIGQGMKAYKDGLRGLTDEEDQQKDTTEKADNKQ